MMFCAILNLDEIKSVPKSLNWPIWADSVGEGAYGSLKSVRGWGGDKPRIRRAWSRGGRASGGGFVRDTRGVQMYSSAIKCIGPVCSGSQTDVTFNERKTRGGNGLMDGYKVSLCNQMSP